MQDKASVAIVHYYEVQLVLKSMNLNDLKMLLRSLVHKLLVYTTFRYCGLVQLVYLHTGT